MLSPSMWDSNLRFVPASRRENGFYALLKKSLEVNDADATMGGGVGIQKR